MVIFSQAFTNAILRLYLCITVRQTVLCSICQNAYIVGLGDGRVKITYCRLFRLLVFNHVNLIMCETYYTL